MGIPVSEQEINFIKSNTDKTPKEIALLLNRHRDTIYDVIKKYNIKLKSSDISEEDINYIRNNLHKNKTELAKILGFGEACIVRCAAKHNIILVKNKRIFPKRINHDFFKIQSPEMAYVLGFIAADGCLSVDKKGYKRLTIELASKDKEHLDKIANIMDFEGKFSHTKRKDGRESDIFYVTSETIFNDLLTYNITPRKSLTLQWPDKLEEKYYPDFIRGYFDGDGYCGIKSGKVNKEGVLFPNLCICILGTFNFLSKIQGYANSINNKEVGSLYHIEKNHIYRLEFSGNLSPTNFCQKIYYNSNVIKMDRKYDRFKKWLEIKDKAITKQDYESLVEEMSFKRIYPKAIKKL